MKLRQKDRISLEWAKAIYNCQECWVSGIYRIVSYRENEYLAFYIVDGYLNWGDFVSRPPDTGINGNRCWRTLEAAQSACEDHSVKHDPKASTVKRAVELFEMMKKIDDEPSYYVTQQSLPL